MVSGMYWGLSEQPCDGLLVGRQHCTNGVI